MSSLTYLATEAKAWLKRKTGPDEVVRIVPDRESRKAHLVYQLYTAFAECPDELGRILFDAQGCWIYDGSTLSVAEQEQVANFIIHYKETI